MGKIDPKNTARKLIQTPPSSEPAREGAPAASPKPRARKDREARVLPLRSQPTALNLREDAYEAPPLAGKLHPPADMEFVVPSSDDARRMNRRDYTEFDVDPVAADAAADLAGDLGVQFLEGALDGEETMEHTSGADRKLRLYDEVIDTMHEETTLDEELADMARVPAPRSARARRP